MSFRYFHLTVCRKPAVYEYVYSFGEKDCTVFRIFNRWNICTHKIFAIQYVSHKCRKGIPSRISNRETITIHTNQIHTAHTMHNTHLQAERCIKPHQKYNLFAMFIDCHAISIIKTGFVHMEMDGEM